MNRPYPVAAAPAQPPTDTSSPAMDPALEDTLAAVELCLASLGEALRQQDLGDIDVQSAELHHALARAVDHFSRAARSGTIPLALRRRLAHTSGHVAAQRESFARATAALDRAIDVLLPREAPSLYGAQGNSSGRGPLGGRLQA